ncbi:MAG: hypothetical protein K2X74_08650 [Acetobacteraceae bacterium]|nr:hypothetical protein [Acetobacteraceae bacterium]
MTTHWMHVTAGYALVLGTFVTLAIGATLRHRAAKATLARLDPRAARRGGEGA